MEITVLPSGFVRDPVCGKDVVPSAARGWDYLFENIVYHFCGSECRHRFQSDPQGILKGPVSPAVAPPPTSQKKSWWSSFRLS